jgi:3D (Asp-Asp-Asp) domain-containing protein
MFYKLIAVSPQAIPAGTAIYIPGKFQDGNGQPTVIICRQTDHEAWKTEPADSEG